MMKPAFRLSDHYDGARFFNPGVARPARGAEDLLRWRRERVRAAWPDRVVDPEFPPPSANVAHGSVGVSFIGHASFLLALPGALVLTDPMFSARCSPVSWAGPRRARPPGIALAALPAPDVVLISHNHYDHMDMPSLRAIAARFAPRFVTLLGNAPVLARHGISAVELDWWDTLTLGDLAITATPARHFSARTPFDRNRALWGGFMIASSGGRVLFAGDSGQGAHWATIGERLGAPDVALLPIGAYEPRWFMGPVHMDPSEAVAAHLALGSRQSVGMHFGTFQLTDEAIDAPEQALAAALADAGVEAGAFVTQGVGETRVYPFGG